MHWLLAGPLPYSKIVDMDTSRLAKEVAARLRAERARVNLTLREVGQQAGVHYVSISRYEQGKLPTLEALYALAETYGVEPGVLLPPMTDVADIPRRKRK